jgi:PTH1 family peptidyl-tRNA hydrolase
LFVTLSLCFLFTWLSGKRGKDKRRPLKYLVVGLGNVGAEYAETRHNIGFVMADALVKELKGEWKTDRLADVAKVKYKSRNLVVIKPSTYMNRSGKAVKYWLDQEKVPLDRLLVILDDIALPLGTLRMKAKGSDAGHNGLSDIIQILNTIVFPRLRIGIGDDFPRGYQSEYVLGEWTADEVDRMIPRITTAVTMVKSFVAIGIDRTMTGFNNR